MAQFPTFWGEVFPPPSGICLTLSVSGFCLFLSGVLSLPSCFASFTELGQLLSPFLSSQLPHVPSPTVCLVSDCLFASFLFLLFPSISIDVGATNGVFP